MSFDIFGEVQKSDIKVGYISTDRGYVEDLTIFEANKYAQKNPGTQFIFKTRDQIRYLNINEVNQLTPRDLKPKKDCGGINLDSQETDVKVNFYGGGGVGVKANPIIGEDGSLLSIDLVSGGFGYKYPPVVRVKDPTGIGAGAVVRAILGETAPTEEVYDQEDDFEIYDFSLNPNDDVNFGLQYNPDATVLGDWDPSLYANLTQDPISIEIQNYQNLLASLRRLGKDFRIDLERNLIRNWWNTRKRKPNKVVSQDKTTRNSYDVQFYKWGPKKPKSKDFVEVEFEVYGQGSDRNRDLEFIFTAEDGSHQFKVKGVTHKERSGKTRKTIEEVKLNTTYTVESNARDKLDKKNPNIEQGLVDRQGRLGQELKEGKGRVIFADVVGSANDNDDIQVTCTKGKFTATSAGRTGNNETGGRGRGTYNLTYKINEPQRDVQDSFMNRYAVSPVPPSNVKGSDFAGIPYTFVWEENFPFDGEYIFKGICDNNAQLYLDNKFLGDLNSYTDKPNIIKRRVKAGVHKIMIDLENDPEYEVQDIPVQKKQNKIICHAGGGFGGRENLNQTKVGTVIVGEGGNGQKGGDDDTKRRGGGVGLPDGTNAGKNYSFSGNGGNGATLDGKIILGEENTNDRGDGKAGGNFGGGGGGAKGSKRGGNGGNGAVRIVWGSTGKSVTYDTPGEYEVEVPRSRPGVDEVTFVKITCIGGGGSGYTDTDGDKQGGGGSGGAFARNNIRLKAGTLLKVVVGAGGIAPRVSVAEDSKKGGGSQDGGDSYVLIQKSEDEPKDDDNLRIPVLKNKGVFNTRNFITKSNRELWKINPGVFSKDSILSKYGVCPFDTSVTLRENPYAGTHVIVWEEVKFPISGNYKITLAADDSVKLYIGNRESGGFRKDGSGLFDDETIIEHRGYRRGTTGEDRFIGRPVQDLVETKFFKKGTYRIRAELEQIPGGRFTFSEGKNANPMALAVDIKAESVTREVEVQRSWNENPMGVALSIDAPFPSPPQEGIPRQEGRCPRNPIWSTRFPNAKEKWYPVNVFENWSKFMNRYAISPVPPLSLKDTDGAGIDYRNSWTVDLPYSGTYALRGTGDNEGRILIDGQEQYKLKGRKKENPDFKKLFLESGVHTIEVEVSNTPDFSSTIEKQIFSTKDWLEVADNKPEIEENFLCHAGGGFGGRENERQTKVGRVIVGEGGDGQKGGDDDTKRRGGGAGLPDGGNAGKNYSFSGNGGNGVTLDGKIILGEENLNNTGDGKAGGNFGGGGGGAKGSRRAGNGGNGAVRIIWGSTGKSVTYDKPGRYIVQVPRSKPGADDVTFAKITCIGGGGSGYTDTDGDKQGGGGSGGAFAKNTIKLKAGTFLRVIVGKGGVAPRVSVAQDSKKGGGSQDGGDSYVARLENVSEPKKKLDGVVYEGPTPIANYKSDFISPQFINVNAFPNEEIQGKTWVFRWKNVEFPEDGRYILETEGDDELIVKIDGNRVEKSTVFEGRKKTTFKTNKGKKTIELELTNLRIPNTGFSQNPAVCFVKITKNVDILTNTGKSWKENPIGVSAILIPPPCPKIISGVGIITDIQIIDPGNTYPPPITLESFIPPELTPGPPPEGPPSGPGTPPSGPGLTTSSVPLVPGDPGTPPGTPSYPVALRLKDIVITDPGINYGPDDQIVIEPDNGAVLSYDIAPFGKIAKVNILDPGIGFTRYPYVRIISDTGINAAFAPQFEVVRDPLTVQPDKLIQVTDLVGLKQTGYVNGRPYYGAVFYKNGIRYAGFYETVGQLVRVYDTLQESITAIVTTPPSAIQRQGTDISSNDPRLNIPGTPGEII